MEPWSHEDAMLSALKVLTGVDWEVKEGKSASDGKYRCGPEVRKLPREIETMLYEADVHFAPRKKTPGYKLVDTDEETILRLANKKITQEGGVDAVAKNWKQWREANPAETEVSGKKEYKGKGRNKDEGGLTLFDM